jgi:hypothetical protein
MAEGLFDLHEQDTTPGANSTFAPERGWEGDVRAYMALMRHRYDNDVKYSQQMYMVANRLNRPPTQMSKPVSFHGPFADTARKIAEKIAMRIRTGSSA